MRVCFDIDMILFEAASVAEEKYITATHVPTGQVWEFENKTELWGEWRKKVGGFIGTQNKLSGNDFYKAEDFVVVDGQRPRPFRVSGGGDEPDTFMTPLVGAKMVVDSKIRSICEKLKATSYFGYTGTGEVFRHKVATLLAYKGNRAESLKPLLLDELKAYVCAEHNHKMVTGIEADDACSIATIAGYNAWKKSGLDSDIVIQSSGDKDSKGVTGWHYNPEKDSEMRLVEGFGSLWLNEKGEVDGAGRMWYFYQILAGDTSDNYKSNCFSDVKYASKGAYTDLKDCTNDKEAFAAMVRVFKRLYPEKKTVEGCKGPVEIDHMYVFQELATLALMLRKPGDGIDVKAACRKLGISYD